MTKSLDEYPFDSLVGGDEWEHVRGLIEEALDYEPLDALPFIRLFEQKAKEKLIKSGFDAEKINDPENLKTFITDLGHQGHKGMSPFCEFPAGVIEYSKDGAMFWIKDDIASALRSIEAITDLKTLCTNNGCLDQKSINVYLQSFKLFTELARAGDIRELALSEALKIEKSKTSREIRKQLIEFSIKTIFDKYPNMPKTLGHVWNKIDAVLDGRRICHAKTKKEYSLKTGKDKNGRDVVIISHAGQPAFEPYRKRSLQIFINKLKKQTPKVTQ